MNVLNIPKKIMLGLSRAIITSLLLLSIMAGVATAGIGTFTLPQTGQTSCYDAAGDVLGSCSATGQDGELQAGSVWSNPRFVVSGDTVTDNLTNLVWTLSANQGATAMTWQDALTYVNGMNAGTNLNYGYTDWRLPNRWELRSLQNISQAAPDTWLADTFTGVKNVYWTSSSYVPAPANAWRLNFNTNELEFAPKSASAYVWVVRGAGSLTVQKTGQAICYDESGNQLGSCSATGQDGATQAGYSWIPYARFVNSVLSTAVVRDQLTGLRWSKDGTVPFTGCGAGQKTWQEALAYVDCLNTNSYLNSNSWRLPNLYELQSLVNLGIPDNASWLSSFGFNFDNNKGYWTSDTDISYPASAWFVNLQDGLYGQSSKMGSLMVLPVTNSINTIITANSNTGGTIVPSGAVVVAEGGSQTFTITSDGSHTIGSVWVDGQNMGAIGTYTFSNVNSSNHQIAVTFIAKNHTISATTTPGCGLLPGTGSISVAHGSNKVFTIIPNSSDHINSVFVDGVNQGTNPTYTFTNVIADNHSIYVDCLSNNVIITAAALSRVPNVTSGGHISPVGAVPVARGGSQTFTITANTGFVINSVYVDGVNKGAITTYDYSNVTAPSSITAYFTTTIKETHNAGGHIFPAGTSTVWTGDTFASQIIPDAGYTIGSVFVDGVVVVPASYPVDGYTGTNIYWFNNLTGPHVINATFVPDTISVTATSGVGGHIDSLVPAGTIASGTSSTFNVNRTNNFTFTVTANAGYSLATVYVDGISMGTGGTYTINNVTASHTINASFVPLTFAVTATSGVGGHIDSIAPVGTVASGSSGTFNVNRSDNFTFTVTANAGYVLATVYVDGVSKGTGGTYTINNVTTIHTINATFLSSTLNITSLASTKGHLSTSYAPGFDFSNSSGTVVVTRGDSITYCVTPNPTFTLNVFYVDYVNKNASLAVDAVNCPAPGSLGYTINNVTKAYDVRAYFK